MPESANQPFSGIFISYRRDDCDAHAGRLSDKLGTHFSSSQIFIDVDNIALGVDFVKALEEALSTCAILLAMIGHDWLTGGEDNARPLEDPDDFVRREIVTALGRGIPVIPILVEGAEMPKVGDLPDDMKALGRRNAFDLAHKRWSRDVAHLISHLETIIGPGSAKTEKTQATESDASRVVNRVGISTGAAIIKSQSGPLNTSLNTKRAIGLIAIVLSAIVLLAIFLDLRRRIPSGNSGRIESPSPQASIDAGLAKENAARGDELFNTKRYSEAEPYYRRAVELDENDARYNNQLGVTLYFQKKYVDADYYLRKAVSKRSGDAQYQADAGNALSKQAKYGEAEPYHREAVRLSPKVYGYHNLLGLDLYFQGKYKDAADSFEMVTKLAPKWAEAWNSLGDALYHQQKYADAKAAYQKALQLDQGNQTYKANVEKVP